MILGPGGAGTSSPFGGGVSASSSSKTRLVANLKVEYDKLNLSLEKTVRLSKEAAQAIRSSFSGGGRAGGPAGAPGATSMDLPSVSKPGGFVAGGGGGQPSSPIPGTTVGQGGYLNQGSMSLGREAVKTAAGFAAFRVLDSIKSDEYLYNDIMTRRFGFYSGAPGRTAGAANAMAMNSAGFAISPTDAINAQAAGASLGLMPGLQKQGGGIFNTVTGLSNLTGAGLEAGMGATAALQQGSSVNKLRMIGVNVRNEQGLPRTFDQIANDLWNVINRSKTGPGKITTKDLDFSLLPGNSLDMLLNQYFGTDAVLRQGVVAALYQKAQGGGFSKDNSSLNSLSKSDLSRTGVLPASALSVGERNAAIYAGRNQMTDISVKATTETNQAMTVADYVIQGIRDVPVFKQLADTIVYLTSAINNFSNAGRGGEGSAMSSALNMFAYSGQGIGGEGVTLAEGAVSPLGDNLVVNSEFNATRRIKQGNKYVTTPPHRGTDFRAGTGTKIKAVKSGRVIRKGYDKSGLGHFITIDHGDGFRTTYGHMKSASNASGTVEAGDPIGFVGQTGFADGPHLHLAVQDADGKYYNPRLYLSGALTDPSDTSTTTTTSTDTSTTSTPLLSLFKTKTSSLFGRYTPSGSGDGPVPMSGGTAGVSYGGVTVNINLPTGSAMDERKLAQEVKRILQDEELLRRTVTR